MKTNLARRTVAEGLGTAILLATVVGSGIMAERLAGGNVAVALLANTIATGAALVAEYGRTTESSRRKMKMPPKCCVTFRTG